MSINFAFNFTVYKEKGKVKIEHQLPPEQDPYSSPPPRKKTASASAENDANKEVETNARKSWKDVDEQISGLKVSTDLLIDNFASDELPDLVMDQSMNVTLGIHSNGPFTISTPRREAILPSSSPDMSPIKNHTNSYDKCILSHYMYSNLQMSKAEEKKVVKAPQSKKVKRSTASSSPRQMQRKKLKTIKGGRSPRKTEKATVSDVRSYPLHSKDANKESKSKPVVEIPDDFDSKLVEECKEYNLHTPKKSSVIVKQEVTDTVVKVELSNFDRGRPIVNPKSRNQNVDVKSFSTKKPTDKKKEVELGVVKIIDDDANVSKEVVESDKKRKMSNPCSASKRVKLELDSEENRTDVSGGRGRPKTTDDLPSTFVKKELPDDPEK